MRVFTILIGLVLLSVCAFAQVPGGSKIVLGTGATFPLEKFSTETIVGINGGVGYEKQMTDKIAGCLTWLYTKNVAKDDLVGSAIGNTLTTDFKYYLKDVVWGKTVVVPYLKFGAGVSSLDYTEDNFSAEFIFGTTTGIGLLWKAKPDLQVFGETNFVTAGEPVTKMALKFGVALPMEL